MSANEGSLEAVVERLLSGKAIHLSAKAALDGLDWELAGTRPDQAPHSIFQLVRHVTYWQEWALEWLDERAPVFPEHAAEGWPAAAAPGDAEDWHDTVERFVTGLAALGERVRDPDLLARSGNQSRVEVLLAIAAHNSYHLGQVVLVRQLLGAWPPPSGGLTW